MAKHAFTADVVVYELLDDNDEPQFKAVYSDYALKRGALVGIVVSRNSERMVVDASLRAPTEEGALRDSAHVTGLLRLEAIGDTLTAVSLHWHGIGLEKINCPIPPVMREIRTFSGTKAVSTRI